MFQDFKSLVVEFFECNSHMDSPLNARALLTEGKGAIVTAGIVENAGWGVRVRESISRVSEYRILKMRPREYEKKRD